MRNYQWTSPCPRCNPVPGVGLHIPPHIHILQLTLSHASQTEGSSKPAQMHSGVLNKPSISCLSPLENCDVFFFPTDSMVGFNQRLIYLEGPMCMQQWGNAAQIASDQTPASPVQSLLFQSHDQQTAKNDMLLVHDEHILLTDSHLTLLYTKKTLILGNSEFVLKKKEERTH